MTKLGDRVARITEPFFVVYLFAVAIAVIVRFVVGSAACTIVVIAVGFLVFGAWLEWRQQRRQRT